jgi:hypothetical protein
MPNDSKDKSIDFIKGSELLNGMKRYFGIESQEDDDEFQKYIRKHMNLRREDKSTKD